MRLINVSTRELEEFYDEAIPQYAILSHTWGPEEVTYQDYISASFNQDSDTYEPNKAGYLKIRYTCAQAHKEGLNYVWIDTCCIDKKSSAELTEAINSMYAWYERAVNCYAYLSDFILDEPSGSIGELQHESEKSFLSTLFRQSRWFTRGWTLQELLAPRQLCFYSARWVPLGRRRDLAKLIAGATGIDTATLKRHGSSFDRRKYDIATRMSWAAGRKTARREDIAYCLLGLFDVNMPLLYGEGGKAFVRLQEEIIKHDADHSIFAWADDSATMSSNHDLLADSPDCFRGLQDFWLDTYRMGRLTAHMIGNTGLVITLPICATDYPGYYKARLRLERKIDRQWDSKTAKFRGSVEAIFLWLFSRDYFGHTNKFYSAAPVGRRLIAQTVRLDDHGDAYHEGEEVREIVISRKLPYQLVPGSPTATGHRGDSRSKFLLRFDNQHIQLAQRYPALRVRPLRYDGFSGHSHNNSSSLEYSSGIVQTDGLLFDLAGEIFPFAAATIHAPHFSDELITLVFGMFRVAYPVSMYFYGILGWQKSCGQTERDCLTRIREHYESQAKRFDPEKQQPDMGIPIQWIRLRSGAELEATFEKDKMWKRDKRRPIHHITIRIRERIDPPIIDNTKKGSRFL